MEMTPLKYVSLHHHVGLFIQNSLFPHRVPPPQINQDSAPCTSLPSQKSTRNRHSTSLCALGQRRKSLVSISSVSEATRLPKGLASLSRWEVSVVHSYSYDYYCCCCYWVVRETDQHQLVCNSHQ